MLTHCRCEPRVVPGSAFARRSPLLVSVARESSSTTDGEGVRDMEIVVVGAGFAGVWAAAGAVRTAAELGREEDVTVTVVAPGEPAAAGRGAPVRCRHHRSCGCPAPAHRAAEPGPAAPRCLRCGRRGGGRLHRPGGRHRAAQPPASSGRRAPGAGGHAGSRRRRGPRPGRRTAPRDRGRTGGRGRGGPAGHRDGVADGGLRAAHRRHGHRGRDRDLDGGHARPGAHGADPGRARRSGEARCR